MPVKMKNKYKPTVKRGKYGQELKVGSGYRFDAETIKRLRELAKDAECSCGEVVENLLKHGHLGAIDPRYGHGTKRMGLSMTASSHRLITSLAARHRMISSAGTERSVNREAVISALVRRERQSAPKVEQIIIDDCV